ncbi:MAG: general secretion pathway protein GspC [Polyangiaceae bacterium]|nr:general secretion pathway protein GspC [Polyangiaceae bacterium]
MSRILKKHFWVAMLALVGACAFFTARVFSAALAIALAADETALSASPVFVTPLPPAPSSDHATSADGLLARNPFDHTMPFLRPAQAAEGVARADDADPRTAPPCDDVKVLVITASSDPDASLAAIQAGADPKAQLRRRGQEVGGKKVEMVGWDRVWLSADRGLCQAELFKDRKAAPPVVAAPPASAPGAGGGLDATIRSGIQKRSATAYDIDRATVDKILENQADLMRTVRIAPGKDGGIQLLGIRPDTLLGVLGMESGDRLQTINGFDMSNPEKALEAYARLRTADALAIQVNRRGQPLTLDYTIK